MKEKKIAYDILGRKKFNFNKRKNESFVNKT